jgi:hypothetical protein
LSYVGTADCESTPRRKAAQDGPVRRRWAAEDERASLRGEYEILLVGNSFPKLHQTSARDAWCRWASIPRIRSSIVIHT